MLAALCLAMVFAISLSSYLALCYTSLNASSRNMMSSHAVELAEGGLEQALYAENLNNWTSPAWTISGSTATVEITGFSFENGVTGKIDVTVTNYNTATPTLMSESTLTLANGATIKRELQASASLAPTFINGVGATNGLIRFNSYGTVDSYDSSQGPYNAVTNAGYSAVLMSQYNSTSAQVVVGGSQVHGYVIGSASNPASYYYGAQIVGPNEPNGVTIDTSRIITESQPSQPQYTENIPTSGTSTSINLWGSQTMTLGNSTDTTPKVYFVNSLTLSNSSQLYIAGPVILVVQGSVSIQNSSQIVVESTGATHGGPNVSLELHVASTSANVNIDGGGINNQTLNPERLLVVGTQDTNGSIEIGTQTAFYGVLDFSTNTNTINFDGYNFSLYGAVLAGSINFNTLTHLHYDVHLQSGTALSGASASFKGPIFNAFSEPGSRNPPYSVSQVVEVAAQ